MSLFSRTQDLAPLPSVMLTERDGVATVNSFDLARQFEKDHDKVTRNIKELLTTPVLAGSAALTSWFFPSSYTAGNGQTQPAYELTRDGFSLLVMGWTGDRALRFKVEYIRAFNEMEVRLRRVPTNDVPARLDRLEGQFARLIDLVTGVVTPKATEAPAAPKLATLVFLNEPYVRTRDWLKGHGYSSEHRKILGQRATRAATREHIALKKYEYKFNEQDASVNTYPVSLLARVYATL
jgi:Rha family phage regulatory protein